MNWKKTLKTVELNAEPQIVQSILLYLDLTRKHNCYWHSSIGPLVTECGRTTTFSRLVLLFSVWCQSHRMSALCKISSTLILVSDRHLLPCFVLLQVKHIGIGINVHDTGSVIIICHYCLSYISVSVRFSIRGMEERISFLLKRIVTHKLYQFKRYFIKLVKWTSWNVIFISDFLSFLYQFD